MGRGSMGRRRGAAFGTRALNPVALAELSPTDNTSAEAMIQKASFVMDLMRSIMLMATNTVTSPWLALLAYQSSWADRPCLGVWEWAGLVR